PQAILPRTFNYGFATGLMLKDVRLCVEEARSLDVPNSVMSAVLSQWETTDSEFGSDGDFTAIVKMVEKRARIIVGKKASATTFMAFTQSATRRIQGNARKTTLSVILTPRCRRSPTTSG